MNQSSPLPRTEPGVRVWPPRRIPSIIEDRPPYRCNTGGPRSRTRTEPVFKTLLGDKYRQGFWPWALTIALDFLPWESPRVRAYELLEHLGIDSPEAARAHLDVPRERLACRTIEPLAVKRLVPVQSLDEREQLRLFVILGSCSQSLYDPARPVTWTNRALTRPVSLFRVGDFYAH